MTPGKPCDPERLRSLLQETPIAVIGMACLFPQARNLREFWDNILNKVDAIIDVPSNRWEISDYYDPDPKAPDKTYCKRGGFLPEIDFDPMEFGLPPNILEVTDVSQLLSLVVAKEVLEDAGYGESSNQDRSKIGVVLGVGGGQKLYTSLTSRLQYPVWRKVLRKSGISEQDTEIIIEKIKKAYIRWEENSFPGMLGNVVAGRVANRLNLGGMNCVVDAACASSLTALKMAISELVEYRSDIMITGGVDTDNSIFMYMCFSKTPAFTDGDRCRPFDADSNGIMIGEGIGMVALKRLQDAERDRDRIYAVIRGIGASSDGRFSSIYNPRREGQAMALRRAYEDAGIPPATVGLIEAHGTGTRAGDPVEVAALKEVFGDNNEKRRYIALGSVKSQIGHTKAAAGSAGLIKAALALHHKILPPTINVNKPDPKLDLDNSPFYLNTETRPWIPADDGTPRRAGVSAFGFGGTNFHVVLEEYQGSPAGPYRLHTVPQEILLSAPTPGELRKRCREVLDALGEQADEHHYREVLKACTSPEPPPEDAARVGFVVNSLPQARRQLGAAIEMLEARGEEESWSLPTGVYYRRAGMDWGGKVVALFPGQGSQYLGMGKELACNFPPVLDAYTEMDRLFVRDGCPPLSEKVFPRPSFDPQEKAAREEELRRTELAQPAIGALSAGLYRILRQAGFRPDFTAGHSFGELTALWAADALTDQDFFALARARGKAMAAPDDPGFDPGTMVAVVGDVDQVRTEAGRWDGVVVANLNSRTEVVLAGPTEGLLALAETLKDKGYRVVPLPVSAAFHTPLVGHAQRPFGEAVQATAIRRPTCKVYSNTTGRPYPSDPGAMKKILAEHILNPVLFREEIENIYGDGGRLFVEFGPRSVLTRLVANILEGKPHVAIALNASPKKDSDQQLREAIVHLRVLGLPLRNVDPYRADPPVREGKKEHPAIVKLTGSNYVSEKTQKAFLDALNDGHQVATRTEREGTPALPADRGNDMKGSQRPVQPGVTVTRREQDHPARGSSNPAGSAQSPRSEAGSRQEHPGAGPAGPPQGALEAVEQGLALFFKHQQDTLSVHEKYLNQHLEYSRTFHDLLRRHISPTGTAPPGSIPDGVERSMVMLHKYQEETLRVHGEYLRNQAELSRSALEVLKEQCSAIARTTYAPVRAAPGPPTTPAAATATAPSQEVTSKEPVAARSPETAPVDPGPLPEIRPSGTRLPVPPAGGHSTAARAVSAPPPPVSPEGPQPAAPGPAPAPAVAAVPGIEALTESMLQVVSEKTGYPVEMLELDMEMEADLGIDSIKRVEILGAMMELHPNLPEINPEELAELRTLGQIVQYMNDRLGSPGAQPAPPAAPPSPEGPQPAAPAPAPAAAAPPGIEALTESMLQVVSEKTGYPVEMLELDMEMEADLGIDLVQLTEIVGILGENHGRAGGVDGHELAELRTLKDLRRFLDGKSPPQAPSQQGEAIPAARPVEEPGISTALVRLRRLPAPDHLDLTLPDDHLCLVTDDGTATTGELARALADKGWKVAVLSLPQGIVPEGPPLPAGIPRFRLDDPGEEPLKERLEEISRTCGPVGGLIHLNPPPTGAAGDGIAFSETSREILLHIFLLAKHLKGSLTRSEPPGRRFFVTVARLNGALGVGEGDFEVVDGGLFGLTKTLNQEWGSVFCRAIDLDPDLDPACSVSSILRELFDPDRRIVETGHGPQGRVTLAAEPFESRILTEGQEQVDSSSLFVVSGGAKGVTAECVARLASTYGCRFILLGRSTLLSEEPDWARGCEEESELKKRAMQSLVAQGEKPTPKKIEALLKPVLAFREISTTLGAIREAGGEAEYLTADVTDGEALARLSSVLEGLGPVTGLIHGAGVLADRLIEKKTVSDFQVVYATKVKGLENLLRCVNASELKYLVLFSSAAGFFGNPGQADYAMANEILNKAAHRFKQKHPGCHVVAFNWGPWDGGMVSDSLKKVFTERNIPLIPIQAGTRVFVDAFRPGEDHGVQILVGGSMGVDGGPLGPELHRYRITRHLSVQENPFLADHAVGGRPVLPAACAIAWMADACAQLYPGYRFFRCADYRTLKGITFHGEEEAGPYSVDIEELRKGDSGEIEFGVRISSQGSGGKLYHHYTGRVLLVSSIPNPPGYGPVDLAASQGIEGFSLYQDGTLFHGPRFRVLERVTYPSPEELTARCRLPQMDQDDWGRFQTTVLNPHVADVLLQAMLVWVRKHRGAASLPAMVQAVETYGPVPADRPFYVSLKVKLATKTRMVADVLAHDETGTVYMRMLGAEVTISKDLNQRF